MNCLETRELVHAYVDEELDPASGLLLENHLNTCVACSAEKDAARLLKTALQKPALRFRAPAELRDQVLRLAKPAAARSDGPKLWESLRLWKSVAVGATAFAALTLLLRPVAFPQNSVLDEAVSSHIRSLMADHLTDVTSTDQHTVKPWFNGKVDFAPNVKDFSPEGFPLVGGRLDYLQRHAVVALVYRHDKHLINVFVWPASDAHDPAESTTSVRGYSVVTRNINGLRYCFVSDLNRQELTRLAALFGP